MSSHNSLHNIETEAGPFPDGLGRKERVKDFSLNLRRHSRPVVHNLNEHEFWFEYRTHLKNLCPLGTVAMALIALSIRFVQIWLSSLPFAGTFGRCPLNFRST